VPTPIFRKVGEHFFICQNFSFPTRFLTNGLILQSLIHRFVANVVLFKKQQGHSSWLGLCEALQPLQASTRHWHLKGLKQTIDCTTPLVQSSKPNKDKIHFLYT